MHWDGDVGLDDDVAAREHAELRAVQRAKYGRLGTPVLVSVSEGDADWTPELALVKEKTVEYFKARATLDEETRALGIDPDSLLTPNAYEGKQLEERNRRIEAGFREKYPDARRALLSIGPDGEVVEDYGNPKERPCRPMAQRADGTNVYEDSARDLCPMGRRDRASGG